MPAILDQIFFRFMGGPNFYYEAVPVSFTEMGTQAALTFLNVEHEKPPIHYFSTLDPNLSRWFQANFQWRHSQ